MTAPPKIAALMMPEPSAALPARAAIERAANGESDHLRNAARYLGQVLDGTYRPEVPVFEMERLLRKAAPGTR